MGRRGKQSGQCKLCEEGKLFDRGYGELVCISCGQVDGSAPVRMEPFLLDLEDAASVLSISKRKLQLLVKEGAIRPSAVKRTTGMRFRPDDLREAIEDYRDEKHNRFHRRVS